MDLKFVKDMKKQLETALKKKAADSVIDMAKKYHVKLNRKLPKSAVTVRKGINEIARETESRIKNWANSEPKDRCYKPTVAINELHKHYGKPCKKNEERTKNFCLKKLASVDFDKVKWTRTVVPNKNTRITIVCPK